MGQVGSGESFVRKWWDYSPFWLDRASNQDWCLPLGTPPIISYQALLSVAYDSRRGFFILYLMIARVARMWKNQASLGNCSLPPIDNSESIHPSEIQSWSYSFGFLLRLFRLY